MPGLGRRIALDVARGLHFLHTNRIVHMVTCASQLDVPSCKLHTFEPGLVLACNSSELAWRLLQDVKTGNVLLGRNYVAKISDVRAHSQFMCCLCLTDSIGGGESSWCDCEGRSVLQVVT